MTLLFRSVLISDLDTAFVQMSRTLFFLLCFTVISRRICQVGGLF